LNDAPWTWTMTWGDGKSSTGTFASGQTSLQLTHSYASAGTRNAALQVRDKDGTKGTSAKSIITVGP
jgi:hypothetical protein